jgi:hypothetical protein
VVKRFLTTAKPSAELLASLKACERYLDAMNIILVRQKIENAVSRLIQDNLT